MNTMAFQTLRALADGAFHSGEDIARTLGVTRSAVWYGIRDISGAGFAIEKVRGRGYRLAQPVSLLNAAVVQQLLGDTPLAVEICDTLDSTNTRLMQRAAQGARSGLALAAEVQTAGRGRRGRVWHSGLGHTLTFSLLWQFVQGARELGGLSLAVGVGLVRALRAAGAHAAQLKWPNDVVLPSGKLAGILIEMQGDVLGPSTAVIGVGVNVRTDARVLAAVDQPVADLEADGRNCMRSRISRYNCCCRMEKSFMASHAVWLRMARCCWRRQVVCRVTTAVRSVCALPESPHEHPCD